MSCDHVRERLMEDAISDWSALEPHLRACPSCAAAAARIREAEEAIAHHLEDFMTVRTLDVPWDRAVATAPGRPSRPGLLITGLVPLAAAAVLALALWQGRPDAQPPEPPHESAGGMPVALTTARDHAAELRNIDGRIPPGLSREEEDRLQRDVLQKRVAAMSAAEAAYLRLVDDPEWKAEAYAGLGDVYAEMAEALLGSPAPTYLSAEQTGVYRMALAEKAISQLGRAAAAYDRALEAGGADAAVEARRTSVAARIAAQPAAARLGVALRTLRERMARCPATPEATAVAAEAERVLEEGSAARDPGLPDRVNQAAGALQCD